MLFFILLLSLEDILRVVAFIVVGVPVFVVVGPTSFLTLQSSLVGVCARPIYAMLMLKNEKKRRTGRRNIIKNINRETEQNITYKEQEQDKSYE